MRRGRAGWQGSSWGECVGRGQASRAVRAALVAGRPPVQWPRRGFVIPVTRARAAAALRRLMLGMPGCPRQCPARTLARRALPCPALARGLALHGRGDLGTRSRRGPPLRAPRTVHQSLSLSVRTSMMSPFRKGRSPSPSPSKSQRACTRSTGCWAMAARRQSALGRPQRTHRGWGAPAKEPPSSKQQRIQIVATDASMSRVGVGPWRMSPASEVHRSRALHQGAGHPIF